MISKLEFLTKKLKKKTLIIAIVTVILIPSIVIPEITNGWIYIKDIILGNVSEPKINIIKWISIPENVNRIELKEINNTGRCYKSCFSKLENDICVLIDGPCEIGDDFPNILIPPPEEINSQNNIWTISAYNLGKKEIKDFKLKICFDRFINNVYFDILKMYNTTNCVILNKDKISLGDRFGGGVIVDGNISSVTWIQGNTEQFLDLNKFVFYSEGWVISSCSKLIKNYEKIGTCQAGRMEGIKI